MVISRVPEPTQKDTYELARALIKRTDINHELQAAGLPLTTADWYTTLDLAEMWDKRSLVER